ncbi:MAG: hypothetical protein ACKVW3_01870 [Phycisphaerales bacterium]
MSIQVSDVIDEAAARMGDPRFTLVSRTDWITIYNQCAEKMTREWGIIEQQATASLQQNEDTYLYPDNDNPDDPTSPGILTQLLQVDYNETPSDPLTWTEAGELFTDEFNFRTSGQYPTGDGRFEFWARANGIQITPVPTTTVVGGLRMRYYRLQRRVVSLTAEPVMEMPGMYRTLLVDLMVIRAKVTKERVFQYTREIQMWENDMEQIAPKIERRSNVRRRQLRPSQRSGGLSAHS